MGRKHRMVCCRYWYLWAGHRQTALPALRLSSLRSESRPQQQTCALASSLLDIGSPGSCRRRKTVAAHDFCHLGPVWWTTSCGVEHRESLAEILRTNRRWRKHAERLRLPASVVIEPMNGASRDA